MGGDFVDGDVMKWKSVLEGCTLCMTCTPRAEPSCTVECNIITRTFWSRVGPGSAISGGCATTALVATVHVVHWMCFWLQHEFGCGGSPSRKQLHVSYAGIGVSERVG